MVRAVLAPPGRRADRAAAGVRRGAHEPGIDSERWLSAQTSEVTASIALALREGRLSGGARNTAEGVRQISSLATAVVERGVGPLLHELCMHADRVVPAYGAALDGVSHAPSGARARTEGGSAAGGGGAGAIACTARTAAPVSSSALASLWTGQPRLLRAQLARALRTLHQSPRLLGLGLIVAEMRGEMIAEMRADEVMGRGGAVRRGEWPSTRGCKRRRAQAAEAAEAAGHGGVVVGRDGAVGRAGAAEEEGEGEEEGAEEGGLTGAWGLGGGGRTCDAEARAWRVLREALPMLEPLERLCAAPQPTEVRCASRVYDSLWRLTASSASAAPLVLARLLRPAPRPPLASTARLPPPLPLLREAPREPAAEIAEMTEIDAEMRPLPQRRASAHTTPFLPPPPPALLLAATGYRGEPSNADLRRSPWAMATLMATGTPRMPPRATWQLEWRLSLRPTVRQLRRAPAHPSRGNELVCTLVTPAQLRAQRAIQRDDRHPARHVAPTHPRRPAFATWRLGECPATQDGESGRPYPLTTPFDDPL